MPGEPAPAAAPPAVHPPPTKSNAGKLLLGCGVFGLASAVICCGCSGVLVAMMPSLAGNWILQDHPLPGPTTKPDPAASAATMVKACTAFAAGEQVSLTPEELSRAALGSGSPSITVLEVGADGDTARLALSVEVDDEGGAARWFNLQMAGTFAVDHGWFTSLRTDTVQVADHDLSPYLRGQDLAVQANQSLANQRIQNPDIGDALDSVEHMEVKDGNFLVKLAPNGAAMFMVCDPTALNALVPEVPEVPAIE